MFFSTLAPSREGKGRERRREEESRDEAVRRGREGCRR